MLLTLLLAAAAPATPISADRIRADVRTLSSDAFAGRGPGEIGEARTIAFLAEAFAAMGLKPAGPNGSWHQDVPLVRIDRLPGATMTLKTAGGTTPLFPGRDATLSLRNTGHTALVDVPVVFAGYGIVDAALGWDAYAGVDMRGKIALVLANDPDFEAGRDLGFEGRRMAYAGRVGMKFEAAAKAGATGVLVIHEDAAASYPFLQVASGDALPAFAPAPMSPSPLKLSGWLRGDVAARLLAAQRLDLARLKQRARNPAFRAFALGDTRFSADGSVRTTPVTSHNVVARLPGATRPDEAVLYGAHWDANGTNGPDATGDGIRNGAIDNATGTAELLEVARAFAKGNRPARTVIFAAWTAEEKGLLGAEYYAAHPLHPLARTAAVINLDPHVAPPAARNIELVGSGRTTLENSFTAVAKDQGLRVDDEPNPEAGWYFRSDHFAFARRGVPALSFRAGRDLVQGGVPAGNAIVGPYNQLRYHQPNDAFDPAWTFAGTAQEASVALTLGQRIANTTDWPGWKPGNSYAAIRAETDAERK
ncbi:M28 family peptidase [Sphingomonas prati]|uniref:Zn-dependent M28 family amino/carboxypeptidase n=1 Tax=Sphingomonas prati TaxID=1843237 RepID=A0A7W9BUT9_9SPHN|nr:M28 family peptidase [Sphingomonas prati]MBB5730512.1 Zn-dependent M28 family amino/carboxypeptidase [Sphingomonas prati]GGE94615.1 peptidase [Sphingomonas prati]